ncbi:MAG: enoyl-CoA hydratase [Clostridiales bacterium]|nr:enoyl-CoA hydratase [Clostridiales bacterium]MCF8023620.1 enoyl-CoA hydratase [Clostridiales bacterium]
MQFPAKMSYKNLLYEEKNQVGIVSLNRPEKRNALSYEVLQELTELLNKIGEDKKVKSVILKGTGKVFSSGHDLKEINNSNTQEILQLFQNCYETMEAMRKMPQPVIAQVHGIATAAGCQLVAACDLAVAAEDARFGTPGVKIGLFCTTPAVFLSRSVGRKKAMEMLLTGDMMPAKDALTHGLVNQVVPEEELEETAVKMAENIAQYSLSILGMGKKAFYQQINMEDFQALEYATRVIGLNGNNVNSKEGISAFLEKRTPQWQDD